MDFVFLDSGTGGIPYLNRLMEVLPDADCVYVGDTANFPYGNKSHEEIVKCVVNLVGKVLDTFKPKIIVIACNTMSVNALDVLRDVYPCVQFVGTVPPIKLAASVSKKRIIGLLATKSTVESPYNMDLKNHFASDCKLVLRGDPELISFVEHESFTASEEEKEKACVPAVNYFRENGCDAIILGCTHFLNIKKEMQKVCGKDISVVDSVEGVTNRAVNLFEALRGNSGVKLGPAERVADKTGACEDLCAQGETSPSLDKKKLFVTGFSDKKDEKEYDVICKRYNLRFGGIL